MNTVKTCDITSLNRETRDYLHGIWRRRGAEHPGIFEQGRWRWSSVFLCLAGVVLLGAAWFGLRPGSLYDSLVTQCGLAAIGFVCLAFTVRSLLRCFRADALGRFTYFDGSWHWEIEPQRMRVTDLRRVVDLQLVNHFQHGARTKTVANIALPKNERASLTFASQQTAERFGRFLQICQGIRNQAATGQLAPAVRNFVSEPGGLAQAARVILDSGGSHVSLERAVVIAIPDPSVLPPGRFSPVRLAWPAGMGLAVFAAGWFGFPPLRQAIDHRHQYLMAKTSPAFDVNHPRAYLEKFPAGRYREEITALLDDRLFGIASRRAERDRSPAAIRDYLAGQPNQRHEEEARRIIGRYYDEASRRVLQLASGQATDKILLAGLLSILDHLKTQPTPRVTVAFWPKWTVEPDTNPARQMENESQSAYAAKDAVIQRLLEHDGTAIIAAQDTFSEQQVTRRESIILHRLGAAVAEILSGDIIHFHRVPPAEIADLTIRYDIRPRGRLIRYVQVPEERPAGQKLLLLNQPKTTNTLGLLREYTIDWRMAIQPGATGTPFTYRLNSISGTNLVYRESPGDPGWAVYAVMMYSVFHDFSNRMLTAAGLTPPPAPTTFTFRDAVER